jgi:hypothetical protein
MAFGPFDLSNATAAVLEFHYWTSMASDTDNLFWGASSSGLLFLGRRTKGDSEGWRQETYDIGQKHPTYLGKPKVWIGFKFESDASGQGEGAYLDDVRLRIQRSSGPAFRAYLPLTTKAHACSQRAD